MFSDDETRLPADGEPARGLLSAGERFGQYEIIGQLGRGGMGEVYEARHRTLGTRHALKLIRSEIVERASVGQRFEQEAKVMARLRHENIVHVDDFGETEGLSWLRMELIEGGVLDEAIAGDSDGSPVSSLADLLRGEPLAEELVVNLLKQILEGLSYAHDEGVVHRDLKPSNILLQSKSLQPKICDFGLVRLVGEQWLQSQVRLTVAQSALSDPDATRLGSEGPRSSKGGSTQAMLGSFEFMAPEQKKGQEATAQSDLYAVGLIAFRMLTGHDTPGMRRPSEIVAGLHPAWDAFVLQALESAPEERFASASAMAAALPDIRESKGKGRPRAKRGQPSPGGRAGAAKGGAAVKGSAPPASVPSKPGSKAGLWIGLAFLLLFGGASGYYFGVMVPERERQAELARLEMEKSQARDAAERTRLEAEAERLRNEQEKAAAAAAAEKERQAELARLEMEKSQARDATERARLEAEAARLRNEQEKAAAAAEAERLRLASARGGIVIRTEPSGALVTVGALVHERASPLTLKDVRLGEYPVSVKAAGYETWTGLVEVKEDRFADPGVVKLTRKMGSVRVTSLPRGAAVWSEGRKLGVTPLSLSKIPEGMALSYELRLEGYQNANVSGKVRYKEELSLRAGLALKTGSVQVTSQPSGASVWSDGRKLGATPLSLSKIPTGTALSYELRLEGYHNASVSGEVSYKDELSLRAELTRKMGSARVTSLPSGAAVWSDGRKLGVTPLSLSKLPVGKVSYELRLEDYHNASVSGEVRYKDELSLRATLEEVKMGSARVTSLPGGAAVWSDGRKLGVTPLSLSKIPVGKVSYELRLEGYLSANVSGKVRYREELSLRATLEEWTGHVAGADRTLALGGSVDLKLKWIASGSFQMGSPSGVIFGVGGESGREDDEGPVHRVTLSRGYWLGQYEVTQGQWQSVMGSNPSSFKGSRNPVEKVSWEDAMSFCKKLTDRERAAGRLPAGWRYTLPTEAQWEYACRAGTSTRFSFGDSYGDLKRYANYENTPTYGDEKTAPVGSFQPNVWGLYDMHGNVWEWCSDRKGNYPSGSVVDPTGASSGSNRVLRGGGWSGNARFCRSAFRLGYSPGRRWGYLGFRLALSSVH